MSIIYRIQQDNRRQSPYPGKYFGHAVNMGTISTEEVARMIERNCSVKRSDVMAVIIELGDVMRQLLGDSHRVRLKGIGSFMPSITGRPCDTPQEYGMRHIKGVKVNFKADRDIVPDTECEPLPAYVRK